MKRIKSVNGYTIYEATSARDEANYNCHVGEYNIYLSSDIRDFGLSNSYPEYESVDSLAVAEAMCGASQYAVAVDLAEELSSSTVQDMDLVLEIERRLEAGEALETIRLCYDTESDRLYDSVTEAINAGVDVYEQHGFDPYVDHPATGRDADGKLYVIEDECPFDEDAQDIHTETEQPTRRSHACYYVTADDDSFTTHVVRINWRPDESTEQYSERLRRAFFREIAHLFAFNDCYDIGVDEIVWDGRPVEYVGWQPGMRITFRDSITGEIVFDESFPEWDH